MTRQTLVGKTGLEQDYKGDIMATQEIVKSEPLQIYMRRPEVVEKFIGLFPNDQAANRYIQSVIILVQSAEPGEYSLMSCSNESVLRSALRAASLRVSVDPALRQAWLVPRKNKKNGKVEAGLQLHYMEIKNRAMRSNRYQFINVSPVYEGEDVLVDIYSGVHRVRLASGLLTSPEQSDRFVPVNDRRGKRQGWLGYFKTIRGAEQTVYMSIDDIEKFVSLHNPYWATSKSWKENRDVMEQKTVLLALLRKADLGDPAMSEIKEIINEVEPQEDDAVDAEIEDVTEKEAGDTPSVSSEPSPVSERPYLPTEFKKRLARMIEKIPAEYERRGEKLESPEGERKILASIIDTIFGGDKGVSRHIVCGWLIGTGSTKEMSPAQVKGLLHVLGIKGTPSFDSPPIGVSIEEFRMAYKEISKT